MDRFLRFAVLIPLVGLGIVLMSQGAYGAMSFWICVGCVMRSVAGWEKQ